MNRGAFLGEVNQGEVAVRRTVAVGDGVGIWSQGNVSGNIIKEMSIHGQKVRSAAAGETVSLGLKISDGSQVYLTSSPRIKIKSDYQVEKPPIKGPERRKVRGCPSRDQTTKSVGDKAAGQDVLAVRSGRVGKGRREYRFPGYI